MPSESPLAPYREGVCGLSMGILVLAPKEMGHHSPVQQRSVAQWLRGDLPHSFSTFEQRKEGELPDGIGGT